MGWVSDRKIMAVVASMVVIGVVFCGLYVAKYMTDRTGETTLTISDARVTAKVADTPDKRQKGLSETAQLLPNHGMLFVFDGPGAHPMWMKDMQYPLDIIWLDGDKRVVHIEKYVTPDTYPKAFRSPTPAMYVLEVPSGFADEHYLIPGTSAFFAR